MEIDRNRAYTTPFCTVADPRPALPTVFLFSSDSELMRRMASDLSEECLLIQANNISGDWRRSENLNISVILWDESPGLEVEQLAGLREQAQFAVTPLLVLTGQTDPQVRAQLLQAGVQDYLLKPFLFQELLIRLRRLLAAVQSPQPLASVSHEAGDTLPESEARFRTITEAMPQMVWSTLPDGYHDYYNRQWYQFTGVPVGSTDGDGWNGMFHPEDQPVAWRAWRHSLATGEPYEIEYRLRHYSGEYRWTLGRALPVRDQNGKITRWMGTCTDIHAQKQAEEGLQEANRHKDEFLAMLAHELRNPLAPLQNSAALIRKLAPAEIEIGQVLDVMERQVRHMARLIDDLLDVARISRGKIQLRRKPCELGEILQQTVDDHRSSFLVRKVGLHLDRPGQRLWVEGDRTRVAQVVGNLLHNALKFTSTGDQVTVSLGLDPAHQEEAVISVKDTGVGIAPEIVTRLFDPFIQTSQALDRSSGGLGLGLALVKGLIELHGGTVEACSAGLHQGATFTFRLPLTSATADIEDALPTASGNSRQLRIMVIDDNRDMVQTLRSLLVISGHEVFSAYDGDEGVEMICSSKPDVVICDIGLPGGRDGYAVAQAVRSTPNLGPIFLVALSGYGQSEDRSKSEESGFDVHLLKPVDFTELERVFARVSSRGIPTT